VIAAAAPLVIHLLNRRRYRVVDWAAMELLREALARNRRILHLRDLLLLALRTLCVLLFALALARPYLTSTGGTNDPNQPVHAVLIVDNSLSMGYQRLDGTLLDEAKARLNEFIDRLPLGSRISVLPACGSSQPWSADVYRTASDAREALGRIEVVDRSALFSAVADLAAQACALAPDVPTKRVVFIGDQQQLNWPAGGIEAALKSLPELQIVQVGPGEAPANAWIADFKLQDDIADVETPAVFTAAVRYDGPVARKAVEVTLTIDGARVASQTIDLEPGQSRQVRFAHEFDVAVEPGDAAFASVQISLTPDQLPADDVRYLTVPVVAALPVLFVDQYGATGENPQKNRYGETLHLRRLLAPAGGGERGRQLVNIRHVTADQVERQDLEECRLVVVAGVESPHSLTPLLREFVEQGGQLFIAAGANFDPAGWTGGAWLAGEGILPLPLKDQPVGHLPEETADRLDPFFLSPDSLTDERFLIADASREELADLYRTPIFFKAFVADASQETLDALFQSDRQRAVDTERRRTDAARSADAASGKSDLLGNSPPAWLAWAADRPLFESPESADLTARRQQPRVLASFSNGVPFLVERHVGRGDILFASTAVFSSWNNLTRTNAVVLFDRLLRGMVARTLPPRNYGTEERVVIPVPPADRRAEFTLERPGGTGESLFVDAVGPDRFAINLRSLTQRGAYRLVAARPADSAAARSDAGAKTPRSDRLWRLELAVNGPAAESELKTAGEADLRERLGAAPVRWLARGEPIQLEGAAVRGQEFWKWLMAGALASLLIELLILTLHRGGNVTAAGAPAPGATTGRPVAA
jgi:Aerotolerance regulator N-terminal/von Willebrand factor type A domain